jgi:hypothetical protein
VDLYETRRHANSSGPNPLSAPHQGPGSASGGGETSAGPAKSKRVTTDPRWDGTTRAQAYPKG